MSDFDYPCAVCGVPANARCLAECSKGGRKTIIDEPIEIDDLRAALREALDQWQDFASSYLNSHSDDYETAAGRIAALRKLCDSQLPPPSSGADTASADQLVGGGD